MYIVHAGSRVELSTRAISFAGLTKLFIAGTDGIREVGEHRYPALSFRVVFFSFLLL